MHHCRPALMAMLGLIFIQVGDGRISVAHAASTDLICHIVGRYISPDVFLSVDVNAGAVKQWSPGYSREQAPVLQATVTENSVMWSTSERGADVHAWKLDRGTGALTVTDSKGNGSGYRCTKASPVL